MLAYVPVLVSIGRMCADTDRDTLGTKTPSHSLQPFNHPLRIVKKALLVGQGGPDWALRRMASEAELPDERLQEAVRLLLKGRDLAGTSLKEVRADLEKKFNLSAGSLDSRREKVKQFVAEEISRIQAGEEAAEAEPEEEAEQAEEDGEAPVAEEEAKEPPKASKPRGSKRGKEAKAPLPDAKRAKGTAEDPPRRSTSGEGKGKGKIKDRQSSSMTREEFMAKAKPITVTIGDKTFKAAPKLFSTGSCGFMASTKVPVEVGGQSLVLQCGLNLPVIGSKEWND
eukprot:s46_g16.t1